jgi:hypothetical protein
MDFVRISRAIAGLKLMKYFPSDEDACIELAKDFSEMAESEEQIEWLVRRVQNLYNEWPGIREVRSVFCSRFKPKDGINAYSTTYLDGVPPERPIAPPSLPALPPGHVVSVDKQLDAAVVDLAKKKSAFPSKQKKQPEAIAPSPKPANSCRHRNLCEAVTKDGKRIILCVDCGDGLRPEGILQ